MIHGFHGLRTTSGPTAQISRPATTIDHATRRVPPRRCATHATTPIAIAAVSSDPWFSARASLPRRRYGTASQSKSSGPGMMPVVPRVRAEQEHMAADVAYRELEQRGVAPRHDATAFGR